MKIKDWNNQFNNKIIMVKVLRMLIQRKLILMLKNWPLEKTLRNIIF